MIAKNIKRTTGDSFKRLAKYIAGAEDEGEKLDDFWIVNSIAGETIDDLDFAIAEIENSQTFNVKTKADKTYHLLVSFRNDKPDKNALKDIEKEFAKALGFEKHQRVVGTHQNTDNFHMHIAYNKINPETFKLFSPFGAYKKLSKVCRDMEKKYNLSVDNGFEKTKEQGYKKPHLKANDFEAKTWQQSFYSYVKESKEPLLEALDKSQIWQDLHNAFEETGLLLKKRGSGLAIVSKDEKVAIKASDLDRSFSKNALEKRLGKFEESAHIVEPKTIYSEKPLTKHPNTEILWKKYQAVKKKPKEQSLLKKAFYTWKDFLMAEATKDPFAMAVIVAQKKLINSITPSFNKTTKPAVIKKEPDFNRTPVFAKENSSENKSQKQEFTKQEKPERIFVEIPRYSKFREEIFELGVRFDGEQKTHYFKRAENINENIEKINALVSLGATINVPADIAEAMGATEEKTSVLENPKIPEPEKNTTEPEPKKDKKSQDWGMGFGI